MQGDARTSSRARGRWNEAGGRMKIAVLEDDHAQAELIVNALASVGHACAVFTSGAAIVSKLRQETFDLLILDWNVPEMSGLDVVLWVRQRLTPPPAILMVTARDNPKDIVEGLHAGADDYLVKPADVPIFLARVEALLRRTYASPSAGSQVEAFGEVIFDHLRLTAIVRGAEAQLTSKEFALGLLLFRNPQRALSRTYIFDAVWGGSPDVISRTLDGHVSKVRSKLGLRPSNGFKLATIYSYGYRLEILAGSAGESDA